MTVDGKSEDETMKPTPLGPIATGDQSPSLVERLTQERDEARQQLRNYVAVQITSAGGTLGSGRFSMDDVVKVATGMGAVGAAGYFYARGINQIRAERDSLASRLRKLSTNEGRGSPVVRSEEPQRDLSPSRSPPPAGPSVGEWSVDHFALRTVREIEDASHHINNDTQRRAIMQAKIADALRAVLAALPHPHGWQDIASAPKDGTRILVQLDDAAEMTPQIAIWHEVDEERDWYLAWDFERMDGGVLGKPTHWQPLPPPPAKEGS